MKLRRTRTGGSTTLLTVIVGLAVLYFARVVFIPIALAVLPVAEHAQNNHSVLHVA